MKAPADQVDVAAMLANCRQYWLNYSQRSRSDGSIDVYRTGVPHPQLNGVIQMRAGARHRIPKVVLELGSMPSLWWIGPDSYPDATQDVIDAGGTVIAKVPVMAVRLEALGARAAGSTHCTIERLEPGEDLSAWVQCYSAPMGVAETDFAAMLHAERCRSDAPGQLTRFAARSGGEIIGTSELFVHEGVAGIYLVTTKTSHRRLGIGTALTYAACMAGLDLGLAVATLQASSSGYPVYRKLGFYDAASYELLAFPKERQAGISLDRR